MVLVILLLTAMSLSAETSEYKLASGQSRIALEVEKTGLLRGKKHVFNFPGFQGKLIYDAQTPANSRVELTIESASIVNEDTWTGEKDKKKVMEYAMDDMLAVKQYPEIRFTSTKITPKDATHFIVDGTLTIKGIGKPVTLETTLTPTDMRIEGATRFKMSNYGLKPPTAGLGTVGTKDEMTVTFRVAAVK